MNFAKLQPYPLSFIQDYVESMRQTSKSLLADVDNPAAGDRLKSEGVNAIDRYLGQLLEHAGQFKGAA